ncbi:uridine kinase [Pseudobacteriovorax antillogorgiicola]|uniref:uridine/cytidine kinase n=1 Tax=Pseudobacteriovorax antillogorgiicola TaxID=1513793 RepID=A0A1Y6BLM5_9BACT|nr:uridine kinase [Pseudobacteriovorax antillogorgiicola]TCS56307.1 uridine kinase [Pseudobacteriovorax antillogorgiicola]SMF07277.1 uridine kinase [Pseudobacteriovorax antillogorgiicola]
MDAPFMVAVSGGSGAGKTTFVKNLTERLAAETPLIISMDDYYRDLSHLSPEERTSVNFDHPKAIERELVHEQISLLRAGVAVEKPRYDFASHTRTGQTDTLTPGKVIILDGIFALCYPELYRLLDLKIFLDVDNDVRVVRRIGRDMAERGRNFESCAQQYLGSVKAMHETYIEPTKCHADFVVPWREFNHRAVMYLSELIKFELAKDAQAES